jgi:DNA-binding response OmpR family regulator
MQPTEPTKTTTIKNILCIEDEHFISELYGRALRKAGYQVDLELDGQLGLEKAQTDAYDVILLDLMIPTITGIEVLRKLRDPVITPHPIRAKVIITTNLEQREDVRADIEAEADGYLVKAEITPRELVTLINNL